jgi:hybrid polyketide synthase/nonribosomal peptide synthetase ACE1
MTQASLASTIAAYSTYLKSNPSTNLCNLAYTLSSRRSAFIVRASFSALSIESLCSKLDAKLVEIEEKPNTAVGIRPSRQTSGLLGVFTGQGAQWASMGKELILSSDSARQTIKDLEESLAALPAADHPSWSLRDEIMADAKSSRISEAAICQVRD